MQISWEKGIYEGEIQNGVPHGRGTLVLPNGVRRGEWQNGKLLQGCEYVDDTIYIGGWDQDGNYHGKGRVVKENGREFVGVWKNGKVIEGDDRNSLPNCVFIGKYYGGICPEYLSNSQFPRKGEIGRSGYTHRVKADHYEMPILSKVFGVHVVCAVEGHNNRWDYSRGLNNRALFFCDKNSKSMYTDAWVCQWKDGDYAPLDAEMAMAMSDLIHDVLASENVEDFGDVAKKFASYKYVVSDEAIYKGEITEGKPTGKGRIVYNHDDEQGRAWYKGSVTDGVPDGLGEMFYSANSANFSYDGGFKMGIFHSPKGKSTLIKQDDWKLYGTWIDGEFEGDDNAMCLGGWAYRRYKGKFVKGQIVNGTHLDPSDKRGSYCYNGPFLNFLPHGHGSETIGEKSWTGYFAQGKRIVGEGSLGEQNAIELYDAYQTKPVNFEDFSASAFSMRIGTDEQDLHFVTTPKLETYSKKIKQPLVLAYVQRQDFAPNSLVKRLFDVDATGSAILCVDAEGVFAPITKIAMEKLQKLLADDVKTLQQSFACHTFEVKLLDKQHQSDWTVTRETHDDYPLEADDDHTITLKYLVTVGDEYYLANHVIFESYPWKASVGDLDEVTARSTLQLHRLPQSLCANIKDDDFGAIFDYATTHGNWTSTVQTERFNGTHAKYRAYKDEQDHIERTMSTLFGKRLELIKTEN